MCLFHANDVKLALIWNQQKRLTSLTSFMTSNFPYPKGIGLFLAVVLLFNFPINAAPSVDECLCEFGIQYMTVRYDGPEGATINVYSTRNQRDFIQQFDNVANGDLLFIDKSDFLKGSVKTKTYLVVKGVPDSEVSYHTSCSEDILNQTKGYFTVTAFQDAKGNSCGNGINLDADIHNNQCYGDQQGAISLNITGGLAPYHINWGDVECEGGNLTSLENGTYFLTVTDFAGNSIDTTFSITSPEPISLTHEISLVDCDEWTIELTPEGGVAPYQFVWSTGDTTSTLNGLSGGTYVVEVTDANGCVMSDSIVIPETIPFSVSIEENTCKNGQLKAVVEGGESPYSYAWSTGETGSEIMVQSSGQYWVGVKDAFGCEVLDTVDVDQLNNIPVTADITKPSCFGGSDGIIDLTIDGEQTSYVYQWDTGETTQDLTNVPAGTYQVTITSTAIPDCSQEFSFELPDAQPTEVYASVTQISCLGQGSITIDSIAGKGPFELEWTTGETSSSINDLDAGIYGLTVVDSAGCARTKNFQINDYQPLEVSISYDFCVNANLKAIVNGGTGPFTYSWNGESGNYSLTPDGIGTYKVVVTDSQGCRDSTTIEITEVFSPLNISGNTTQLECNDPASGTIDLSVSGGTGPYDYLWSNGSREASIDSLGSGYYEVTVTDQKGCQKSRLFSIRPLSTMSLSANISTISCEGGDGSIALTVDGGTSPYRYEWSNGGSGSMISELSAGDYQVDVIDANECLVSETFTLAVPDSCDISNGDGDKPDNEKCCDGKVTTLTLAYRGSVSGFVEVIQKIDQKKVFSGQVNHGEEFTIVGLDRKGTFGPEIVLYVDNVYAAQFHTSCSEPIGPGVTSGDFVVISGESRNGGLLCTEETNENDDDLSDDDFCLYPNPSNGSEKLKLRLPQNNERFLSVNIYDLSGQLRKSMKQEFEWQPSMVDISELTYGLSRGQYIIKISLGSNESTERLVIR